MRILADRGAEFWGQGVSFPGHAMYKDFDGIPQKQRTEFPVEEDFQLGMAIGYCLEGDALVVSLFPRMDFMMCCMNQLVLHLDKIHRMSRFQWNPKVIIRTRIGSTEPLDAGPQHTGRYTEGLQKMLKSVNVMELTSPAAVQRTYELAATHGVNSSIIVEAFG